MPGGTRNNPRMDDDATERLINKVCANFVEQLEERLVRKMDKLDASLAQVCDSLKGINSRVTENDAAIEGLQKRCEDLEQYCRRNTLRFLGINEVDNENLLDVITSFIASKLSINCLSSEIEQVFRQGSGTPRAIVVKFATHMKRRDVFMAKARLKDTSYVIYEDLIKSRYNLLSAAKKKYGKKKVWSNDGRVYYWNMSDKKKVLVNTLGDL